MRIKKTPQADLSNKRSMFTLIGLVITLGFAYILFEWAKGDVEKFNMDEIVGRADGEEDQIDITTQDEEQPEPEPEPEPQQETPETPDQIIVVDDTTRTQNVFKGESESQKEENKLPTFTSKDDDDEGAEETPILKVQKKAEFPGGKKKLMEYLSKNLSYPQIAMDEGIEGVVLVKFVVSSKGVVKDVKVTRSVDPVLDQEAVRVVSSMPNWTPAEHNNKNVASYYQLPVNFTLNR